MVKPFLSELHAFSTYFRNKGKLVDNMIESNYLCVILHVNPRTYKQIHTPIVLQGRGGRWMEPLSAVFDMLQYFETILPLVESL